MAEFLIAAGAEAELDEIWLHIAREIGSVDIANRVIDSIAERFWLLAEHPYIGRRRDDWRIGLRSFAVDETSPPTTPGEEHEECETAIGSELSDEQRSFGRE